ncbi:GNAT family N-acetyltransferase [Corynebacterium sp. UMB4614]|uniref:GNAT family N-acetyltransferase n=1 Tax=Corynebacterium sp. UMB4614 TaxID=3046334 RepID=UPI002550BAEF|nr:GNAT family N-acetyltransferase [Corynebacterium sp. UMB4614]MDK7135771.1 GNAT family N-acetyltransferase [Corynebacterium sp. UMB4614]
MTASDTQRQVRKEADRFVIEVGGEQAGFAAFEDTDGVRDFNHTVVDPAFRGQGLSKPLIAAALDATREEGLKVRPTCSAVAGFVEKNQDDYGDLVVE